MKILSALLVPFSLSVLTLPAQAKTTTAYPDIVPIFSTVSFDGKSESAGRCSGTFIHPRLILTAAHCVTHFNVMKINGRTSRFTDMSNSPVPDLIATPAQVYTPTNVWWGTSELHPIHVYVSEHAIPVNHGDISLDYVEQDLAILEFASNFPHTREIESRTPVLGQSLLMAGYGKHGYTPSGAAGFGATYPTKHFGKNKLTMTELDMLVSQGSAATCDDPDSYTNDWAICGGDSGSPLLDGESGKILGVASASVTFENSKHHPELKGRKLSVYTDVTSGRGAQFIRDVLAEVQTHKAAPAPQGRSGD